MLFKSAKFLSQRVSPVLRFLSSFTPRRRSSRIVVKNDGLRIREMA